MYLVTGAAGFIGSNLVEAILGRGERVRLLDNFATGKRANLSFLKMELWPAGSWDLVEGDIRDLEMCRRAVKGVKFILHQAALGSVTRSVEDPLTTHQVNLTGTLNMLIAARDEGVKRFVYASSSSAYGDTETLPKVETLPARPLSPYAISKYGGELYCQVFFRLYGLETVVLRYFNVYGPHQDPSSLYAAVIPRFLTALIEKRSPLIYGDGTQSRDFTYVADCVRANLLACEAEGVAGEVINLAGGRQTSVLELWRALAALDSRTQEPKFEAARPGDVRHSLADLRKARQLLGYRPQYELSQGLQLTWQWRLKSEGKAL